MTPTLFPELEHGEGGDTAVEVKAEDCVDSELPRRRSTPRGDGSPDRVASAEAGDTSWSGLTACYWLVYPASVHAVCCEWAAGYFDAGRVIMLGTWADAEAVRKGMEHNGGPQ